MGHDRSNLRWDPQRAPSVPARDQEDAGWGLDTASPKARARGAVVSRVPSEAAAYQQFCAAARDCERDLYSRAIALTRNPADAQDLTQRALERGLKALHGFQAGTNIRVWLLRILVNLFLDDCRKTAHGPKLEPLGDGDLGVPSAPLEPDEAPAWQHITSEQFQQALLTLAPMFREVYEMRVRENLRYEQIAARLEIPVATVGTRLARARQRLYELLGPIAERRQM